MRAQNKHKGITTGRACELSEMFMRFFILIMHNTTGANNAFNHFTHFYANVGCHFRSSFGPFKKNRDVRKKVREAIENPVCDPTL